MILSDLNAAGHDVTEGVLPLLSQAMMLTWGKREGSRLTVRGYNETGGVASCVEFGAEAVYEALPDAGQHAAREIFQALVLVSQDGQLVGRPVPRAELVRRAARTGARSTPCWTPSPTAACWSWTGHGPDRSRRAARGPGPGCAAGSRAIKPAGSCTRSSGGRRQVGQERA